jgi:signal transduction histidine kinase
LIKNREGKSIWAQTTMTPILDTEENVVKIVLIDTDISEIKQAEQKIAQQNEELIITLQNLKAAQTELVQAEKMASLGQLVAGIAHEINTPIGAIKASAGSVIASSETALEKLPKLLKQITEQEQILFFEMLDQCKNEKTTKSSSEERTIKKEIKSILETYNIEDARKYSEKLTDIRIYYNIETYIPLLKSKNCEEIIQTAFQLSELQKNSQNIEQAIERVSKIVFALKNFARKDISGEKINTNIIDSIETVLTLYHNQLKQGINIVKKYEVVPEILVFADELNQVWTNLIHNAIQAMNGKGTLTISVNEKNEIEKKSQLEKKWLVVAITDTGTGIAENIKNKIFDAFFTTKSAGEGTGLGLDIVKRIIDKHNAKIWFDSEEGKGTTFYVELPIN